MITDAMKLTTYRDAQEERVADWIWENKPEPGCTWEDFQAAHADTLESDEFWEIAGDCE